MGEVYRARDARLRRDVALKVLHRPLSMTPEHVERFVREWQVLGSLNHPNIVTVFDVGTEDGVPYFVSELLEGESLRDRMMGGALPYRKALDFCIQILDALGAAHEKGIVHRDVKPENAFVTGDGRVKLLDFGLAKLMESEARAGPEESTANASRPGAVRGTAGYMSPEQVLGAPVDHRADLFSVGVVLYEMLTGVRAFLHRSPVETMNAVLKEEPKDPLELNASLPMAAAAVLRRCLEKNREERFQSARDLAFHLHQLSELARKTVPPSVPAVERARRAVLAGLALAALVGWAEAIRQRVWPPPPPSFERLTFSRGRIGGARFTSDPEAFVYSEAREGHALQVLRRDRDSPESRPLGYPAGADVLAVRPGQIALSAVRHFAVGERFVGTLAVATGGGAPRNVRNDVEDADWDPAGSELAAACSGGVGGDTWLEYPLGHKRYKPPRGSIGCPRVSRDGRRIAFLEDPAGLGLGGQVVVLDLKDDRVTRLTGEWKSARGLAWSANGEEIWFTAGEWRENRALRAVSLKGAERLVHQAPASLTLWDIAPDGRVLFTLDEERKAIVGVPPGETTARDLSWQDRSGVADLSSDGRWLLFGDRGGVYVRRTDGSSVVHLGLPGGFADALSPDGKRVLATNHMRNRLVVLLTGVGEEAGNPEELPNNDISIYEGAQWFPDAHHILFNGRGPNRDVRAYVQDLRDGSLRELTPEGTRGLSISSDGERVAATGPAGVTIWDVTGAVSHRVAGSEDGDRPVAWSADGKWLWIFRRGEVPARVYRLEIATGRRHLWNTLMPPDAAGVYSLSEFHVTPAGDAYFYSYLRVLSQLYVGRGFR